MERPKYTNQPLAVCWLSKLKHCFQKQKREHRLWGKQRPKLSDVQTTFTLKSRTVLVEWMLQVAIAESFEQNVIQLATDILDRAMCRLPDVHREEFQCMGAACLWLGMKMHEDTWNRTASFMTEYGDGAFTNVELKRWERTILYAIDYKCHNVVPADFIQPLAKCLQQNCKNVLPSLLTEADITKTINTIINAFLKTRHAYATRPELMAATAMIILFIYKCRDPNVGTLVSDIVNHLINLTGSTVAEMMETVKYMHLTTEQSLDLRFRTTINLNTLVVLTPPASPALNDDKDYDETLPPVRTDWRTYVKPDGYDSDTEDGRQAQRCQKRKLSDITTTVVTLKVACNETTAGGCDLMCYEKM